MAVVEEAKTLFQQIIKTIKSLQMYGSSHPSVQEVHQSLFTNLEDYSLRFGELSLEIKQFSVFCDGEEIYKDEDRSSSLPYRLFSDGIRMVIFHPGITAEELKDFLHLLIKEVKPQEEDLATLIWESDFGHITCDIVQQGVEVPEEVEPVDYLSEKPGEKIHLAYPIEEDELRKFNIPISEVALNDEEISHLKDEVATLERSVFHDFIVSFERSPITNEQSYIIFFDGLTTLAQQLLSLGDLEGIARLIRLGTHEEFKVKEPLRLRFEKFVEYINSKDFVEPFIKYIINNWRSIDQTIAKEIMSLQDERSIPILFQIYRVSKGYDLEHFLARRMVNFGEACIKFFEKIVAEGEEDDVLTTLKIITDTEIKNTTDFLVSLFSFPSPEVKMKAIETMIALGEGDAISNISRLINDPNESVRTATVKAIARFNAKKFIEYLFEIITGDDFKDRIYEEKRAFVFAYCDLAKDLAIPFLEKTLNKWNPMKATAVEEMRNLAALGLGRIGSSESLSIILKGSKSRRKALREAAVRGLKLFEKRGRDDREGTEKEG
ncbi:MAG TPA: HEAT repeat domain-containing protein [bacterium (Candidatus Stahlbacteria)]|nr:HEAT repeat domain-containing protein [Candidatus Stahlbacteria bacterium]